MTAPRGGGDAFPQAQFSRVHRPAELEPPPAATEQAVDDGVECSREFLVEFAAAMRDTAERLREGAASLATLIELYDRRGADAPAATTEV